MKIGPSLIYSAIICAAVVLCSFQAKKDKVVVLAGKGIVLNGDSILLQNGDSILLQKTSFRELSKILNIKEKKGYAYQIWDGFEAGTGGRVLLVQAVLSGKNTAWDEICSPHHRKAAFCSIIHLNLMN